MIKPMFQNTLKTFGRGRISLSEYTLFQSLQDVFPLPPPSSAGTCDSHRGRRAVSLRMSLEKHVGDNDGGGRKEKKKKVPQGLWGPAKQLNGCKQHHGPHVQTFKISAHVMGSAWPLSGRTKHPCSFPSKVLRGTDRLSRVLLSICRFDSPVWFYFNVFLPFQHLR